MTCNHDPLFTNDGRCMKCYPPKRAVMVKHADGTVEIEREWINSPAYTLDNLSDEVIAQMEQRCAETASVEEYSSATEGIPW